MLTLLLAASLLPLAGEPFSDLDYDAAIAKSKADGKLLLVDFTASWCGPCKKMEKDTWGNAEVRAWLGKNALALQIDVDEQKDVARNFQIEAMPTVVALKDGKEFDRVVGYRDAQRFLAWGNDLLAGKSTKTELEDRVKALAESDDVQARYRLAQDLVRAQRYDEALRHFLWLWPASREASGMGGVRVSYMLTDMARLAERSPPAAQAFDAIFAELQIRVDAADVPKFEDWQEWTAFCETFRQPMRVLTWYEGRRDAEGRLFGGRSGVFLEDHIVGDVFDALMKARRPLDAVRLYADVRSRAEGIVAEYAQMQQASESFEPDLRAQTHDFHRRKLTGDLTQLYAALLAAKRDEEAQQVATVLLAKLDEPDARIALVRAGLDVVDRPDPTFARWIAEAEAAGGNVASVRKKLEKLEKRQSGAAGGR